MKTVLATLNAKYIHSSLALRLLRAFVRKDFPNTTIAEYTIKDLSSQIVADLYRKSPDVIGFSTYIWNVEETIPVIQMLKKILPSVVIVLGGPEVSYDVKYWMNRIPEVDYIVVGEGEATFHELLTKLSKNLPTDEILGIAHRTDGVKVTPARPKLDLATIPSPFDDTEDLKELRNRVVYFESSRGCPFSCQFCLSSIESGVRYYPIDTVKAELTKLIDAGIRTIKFVDRTFNLSKAYALELFEFLIQNQKDSVFQFEITGDILPPEIVDYLAEHAPPGLFRFEIGVQSTNDVTNTLVKRRQNFEKLARTIQGVKASGKIVQHLDLIAGLPEEDYTSFKKTFNDVFAFEPEELQLGFLKMLRGTGLRMTAERHGYVYMDHAPYEILGNNLLSYSEILRIKQVEDILEKYWNDGKLRRTTQYLTTHVFPTPFDFFQDFGTYWDEHGWGRIGHQFEDLFLRLNQFLTSHVTSEQHQATKSLMMLEYLIGHRMRPHKVWWSNPLDKRTRLSLKQQISSTGEQFGDDYIKLGISDSELEKHTAIEILPDHPLMLLNQPSAPPEPTVLLVYYKPGLEKGDMPQFFFAPLEQFNRAIT